MVSFSIFVAVGEKRTVALSPEQIHKKTFHTISVAMFCNPVTTF